MRYVLYVAVVLYALLCMLAATIQMKTAKNKDTSAMMLSGSLVLIVSVISHSMHGMGWAYAWGSAALGGVLICIAAFLNGKRSGTLHVSHHIVRFAVTALFAVGFFFLK